MLEAELQGEKETTKCLESKGWRGKRQIPSAKTSQSFLHKLLSWKNPTKPNPTCCNAAVNPGELENTAQITDKDINKWSHEKEGKGNTTGLASSVGAGWAQAQCCCSWCTQPVLGQPELPQDPSMKLACGQWASVAKLTHSWVTVQLLSARELTVTSFWTLPCGFKRISLPTAF